MSLLVSNDLEEEILETDSDYQLRNEGGFKFTVDRFHFFRKFIADTINLVRKLL